MPSTKNRPDAWLVRAGRGALVAVFLFSAADAAAEDFRVEDAVRLALANNERAKKAPLRVEQAEGQLDRARAGFFPQLTAGASQQFRFQEDRNNRSTSNNGTVTINQPLLNPSLFPQYSQSSHQLESEKWGSQQDRRQLAFETARAFLQTLTAERVAEAAQRRLDRAKANQQNAEARAAAGLASINDATRATLDAANAAREVATATGSAERTRVQLGFLCGAKVEGTLAPPDRTTKQAEAVDVASKRDLEAARDRRPDVRSSHERTEALRASAREPNYRLIPSLNATGQMRVLPDPQASERAHEESITLNLQWTIFDNGSRYADRRTRLAQAESQSLDEQLLRRSVDADVQGALATLRAAREAYRITEDAIAAATKSAEETEILYRQGLARAIELTDANARRFDAEVSRASAKLSMEQAYLELRFALGYGPVDE
jgi:outer membrane protein TolC